MRSFYRLQEHVVLIKCVGRTGEYRPAGGLDSTDRAQRGPCEKDRRPIFSQCRSEKAWIIRDLLHDEAARKSSRVIARDHLRHLTFQY